MESHAAEHMCSVEELELIPIMEKDSAVVPPLPVWKFRDSSFWYNKDKDAQKSSKIINPTVNYTRLFQTLL